VVGIAVSKEEKEEMIKVNQEVDILEENDKEVYSDGKTIGVESHWNHNDWVVLVIGDKRYRIAVAADDLEAAIDNAQNVNRF